ncbi:hypothetical protein ABFS82_14G028300 [Erythranthe guttata]
MVLPQEHLPIEEITSPFGAQMFDFYESELFPETLQNSEVASSSNCCYEEHSSYQTPLDTNNYHNNNNTLDNNDMNSAGGGGGAAGPTTPAAADAASNLSVFLEEYQINNNDISASIDFTLSPSSFPVVAQYPEPFSLNNHTSFAGDAADIGQLYTSHQYTPPEQRQVLGPPASFKEELMMRCVPPSFIHLRSSSSPAGGGSPFDHMMGPSYLPPSAAAAPPFAAFDNSLFLGSDQELDFQGDNIGGLFLQDSMARVFNFSSGDLQGLSGGGGGEQRQQQNNMVQGSPISTNLVTEISGLEDPSFKVGKLSPEERKKKIHRYLKKRNERNFSKKIKYACRKTLADSRPRVRGRFAKNDELAELARNAYTNHGDDTDDDVTLFSSLIPDHHNHKVVKEAEGMESADMFAQINGVNSSFKSNYPIQSWI